MATQWFSVVNDSVVTSATEVRARGLELRLSPALCLRASHLLISLRLSVLTCDMGTALVPASQIAGGLTQWLSGSREQQALRRGELSTLRFH